MRRLSVVLAMMVAWPLMGQAQDVHYMENLYQFIENTDVFELNQEEGHAYFVPEKHLSLNGDWKFKFTDVPEKMPKDFFEVGYDDRAWADIAVPSNWEMQGFGDAMFRNVSLSFQADPPNVPRDYNPTGRVSSSVYCALRLAGAENLPASGEDRFCLVCLDQRP